MWVVHAATADATLADHDAHHAPAQEAQIFGRSRDGVGRWLARSCDGLGQLQGLDAELFVRAQANLHFGYERPLQYR